MANILLTQSCNQACPYCFASYHADRENIDRENFLKAVDFITRTPGAKIGLLGGEPLLHPEFTDFCRMLDENPKVHAVVIFTNGLLLHRSLPAIRKEKFALLINCNEKSFYKAETFTRLKENIISAVEKLSTDNVMLGLNIYKDNMEIGPLVSLMRQLGMHKLRISLAILNSEKKVAHRDQFQRLRKELFRIFAILAEADIVPQFDCNKVPLCYYSADEIQELKKLFGKKLRQTNLMSAASVCKPVLDIYPDLTVCRCFGCTEPRVDLLGFRNTEDISRYFFNKVDKYRFDGPFSKCRSCYLNSTMNCMGGCLSHGTDEEES